MWLWFRPITPKRTGLSRGATIDRVYHDAPARARCSSTGTSPRVAGHSACLLRILIELRWRCVPLAEPTDRVAKGVERLQPDLRADVDHHALRMHLPGAVLGMTEYHFSASSAAWVRILVGQPDLHAVSGGVHDDGVDEREPAVRQVRCLEPGARHHLNTAHPGRRHGRHLPTHLVRLEVPVQKPH